MKTISAADLFCGAGGTSTGLVRACRKLNLGLDLVAVNHWPIAVATHEKNHPWAKHLCADLASIDPSKVIPSGRLNILVASPECTHHSVARGGKPCSDQSRASAWHVLHWAERLRIDNILIENVKEFQSWGPLTQAGRPDKRRKGETFKAFLRALESLGYTVDFRVLNAADYGDATTRRRLFVQARRGAAPVWPEQKYAGHWRPAREIIDWSLKGESIFKRKRPLAPRTMKRIEAGLRKFGGMPFVTVARGPEDEPDRFVKSVDIPLPVFVAGGKHLGLVEPFLVNMKGQSDAASIDKPAPTITAHARHLALCEPFLLPHRHAGFCKDNPPRSTEEPLPTLTACSSDIGLVQPFLVEYHAEKRDGEARVRSLDDPLPTQTTENRFGLAEPFLVKYFRTGTAQPVSKPLDTVTTKPRFGLVEPVADGYRLDIRFRMLQPHELAAAMSFEGYEFTGTKEQKVRQIGNAVPVRTAEALCRTILGDN